MTDGGPDPRPWFVGVDAGNSKTVAVIAEASGRIIGRGRAGQGDIYRLAGAAAAVEQVVAALDAAVADVPAASRGGRIEHTAFCLAGVDWDVDHAFWQRTIRQELRWEGTWSLRNDGFALLRAGAPAGTGLALSAGTGAAITARGPGGEWSASFWMTHALGGGALGSAAMDAVVRAELGMSEPTVLTESLGTLWGEPDVGRLLEAFTGRQGAGERRLADAARAVLDAAEGGDPAADRIVTEQAETYAAYAEVAARRAGLVDAEPVAVVLGGSVMTSHSDRMRTATMHALAERLPHARAHVATRPPAVGAVMEALAEGLGGLTPDVLVELDAHTFPENLFVT